MTRSPSDANCEGSIFPVPSFYNRELPVQVGAWAIEYLVCVSMIYCGVVRMRAVMIVGVRHVVGSFVASISRDQRELLLLVYMLIDWR